MNFENGNFECFKKNWAERKTSFLGRHKCGDASFNQEDLKFEKLKLVDFDELKEKSLNISKKTEKLVLLAKEELEFIGSSKQAEDSG